MKHALRATLALLLFVPVLLTGCTEEAVTTYETRGRVVSVTPETNTVTILHEAIPGYMESMSMDYVPRDLDALNGLMAGDLVSFAINVAEDGSVAISDIEKLDPTTQLVLTEPVVEPVMPDTTMLMDSTMVMEDSVAVQ